MFPRLRCLVKFDKYKSHLPLYSFVHNCVCGKILPDIRYRARKKDQRRERDFTWTWWKDSWEAWHENLLQRYTELKPIDAANKSYHYWQLKQDAKGCPIVVPKMPLFCLNTPQNPEGSLIWCNSGSCLLAVTKTEACKHAFVRWHLRKNTHNVQLLPVYVWLWAAAGLSVLPTAIESIKPPVLTASSFFYFRAIFVHHSGGHNFQSQYPGTHLEEAARQWTKEKGCWVIALLELA